MDTGYEYSGQLSSGKPHGKGKMVFGNGAEYEGDFRFGFREGTGTMTYNEGAYKGDKYSGEWKSGKMNGKGKYTWENGDEYEGDFLNGKKEGKGRMSYTLGHVYVGEWKDGKRDGKGRYTFANGKVFEGIYRNGKKEGWGFERGVKGELYQIECKAGAETERVKVEAKKVVIIGGGPVGLIFAHLLLEYGRRQHIYYNIYMFDERWKRDKITGEMIWKTEEDGLNRNRQIVTLQANVWSLLPYHIQEALFTTKDEDYSEMWLHGPDSPREVGCARNIPTKLLEDKLLLLLQNDREALVGERAQISPSLMNKRVEKSFFKNRIIAKGMDYMILADGGTSHTEKLLNELFDEKPLGEKIPFPSDKKMEMREDILGIYVDLNNPKENMLGISETMALTVSQNRCTFNCISGKVGLFNLWLTKEEKELVHGETAEGTPDKSPGWFTQDENGDFVCPISKSVFAPYKHKEDNVLWKTITNGLKLYGMEPRDVKQFIRYQVGPYARRIDFHGKVKIEEGKLARAFLLGDAAINVNYRARRGLNTGIKGAVNLARLLTSIQDDRVDASFLRLNSYMVLLQEREVAIRSMLPLYNGTAADATTKEGEDITKSNKEWYKDRVQSIATKTLTEERLPTGIPPPNMEAVNRNIDSVDDAFVGELFRSNAWPVEDISGDEVGQELAEPMWKYKNY